MLDIDGWGFFAMIIKGNVGKRKYFTGCLTETMVMERTRKKPTLLRKNLILQEYHVSDILSLRAVGVVAT